MTVMYNRLAVGTRLIGNQLVDMLPEASFEHRLFPYPGINSGIVYQPDLPTIMFTWDGIAEDRATENDAIRMPSVLRYEARVVHISNYGPAGITDGYAHAQEMILDGTDAFFSALEADRTLGGLVLDVEVESSLVDDLSDEFYGHQMTLLTRIFV